MASIKIVLRKKQNKDGTYPLAIRVTKDRASSYIHLGKHILLSDWNEETQRVKKSHPNSTRLNNFLIKKLSESNDKLLEIETQKKDISSRTIKNGLKPGKGSTFFAQAKIYLDNLKISGKRNRLSADEPRVKHFREFLNGNDIFFQEINIPLLEKYRAYLKGTRSISETTIVNHLIVVRTVFSQAIKAELIDAKHYPFGKERVRIRFPQTVKIGLSEDDVKKLEELKLEHDSPLRHPLNIWLFSFYFAGMRVSDVLRLRWSDFQNDRLYYSMGKNDKAGSLKVPEKALKIIAEYKDQKTSSDDLIFPYLKMLPNFENKFLVQQKIANAVNDIDKKLRKDIVKLAGIDKKLTMHIARHTFGNISGDKISIHMLQKLYRHASITTTIGYQANHIHKDADEALDAVLKF